MEIPLAGYAFGTGAETIRGISPVIGMAGSTTKTPGILCARRSKLVNLFVTDDATERARREDEARNGIIDGGLSKNCYLNRR